MDILIVGAGSIGVYLGTLLYSKGHNLTLLGGKKLRKLHDSILINDVVYQLPKRIYSMPKNAKFDFVFITSKLYDLEKNLRKITENNVRTRFLISIQNGIVEGEVYEKYIKNINFASISVYEGFRLLENQLIVNKFKSGWKTDNSKAGKETAKILQGAGINCTSESNLESLKAEKLIMNCCVNILSAIMKKTFFELYNDTDTKKIMDQLFEESYTVLSKKYKLQQKQKLRTLFYEVIKPMKHYSSTYQDAISGRKTEIDFINGLIIKIGKKYRIPTPTNQQVIDKFFKKYPKSKIVNVKVN